MPDPISPIGAATAADVLGDEIVRVWTDGLTGAELELEPLTDADVAATGCPAQDRYRDPRKRVPVEDLGRCVGDEYDITRTLGFGGFGVPDNVATGLFSTMISGAREQAKARGVTGDLNSQIDFLRPYFDVETSEVRQRLLWAMHPRKGARLLAESDLYVPTLLAFTLAALLVAGMKSQELKSVGAEGTLIGTALGAAFSLWGLGSLLLYGVAYLLQLRPRLAQVCGLTGYALCGVCVPLLLGLLPLRLFYPALLLLGGASAASLGGGFATFAESPRHAPRPEA